MAGSTKSRQTPSGAEARLTTSRARLGFCTLGLRLPWGATNEQVGHRALAPVGQVPAFSNCHSRFRQRRRNRRKGCQSCPLEGRKELTSRAHCTCPSGSRRSMVKTRSGCWWMRARASRSRLVRSAASFRFVHNQLTRSCSRALRSERRATSTSKSGWRRSEGTARFRVSF